MDQAVADAIKKGQRNVNVPVFAIQSGLWVVCIILMAYTSTPVWIGVVIGVLAFVFAWLYWSFAITRWRLWAFEHVRNVHQLKERAIAKKLLWPDGNIFEKTEIRTAVQRKKWENLKAKFDIEDIVLDPLDIDMDEFENLLYIYRGRSNSV
jgi:hypothetical protein